MIVQYCGPALDYSGYGEANRHDIAALTAAGVEVTGEYTRHCLESADFGELGDLARDRGNLPLQYDIKIMHTTPNIFGRFIEPGKYHIGRVFWETDTLPDSFAAGAELCDEIWTGSQFNAAAIKKAGVTKPIYIIPEAIKTPAPESQKFITANKKDFKFYSIFEWTERKNPRALLETYWRTFEGVNEVSLTLKTYVDNFTPEKRNIIRSKFKKLKLELGLKSYAPVYLYSSLMDRSGMYRFHNTFDCFVSSHRGEGWGIPQMEAMLSAKPVISTGCGGIHEYIAGVAKLIDYKLVNLSGVDRNAIWYTSSQKWAEIDTKKLSAAMMWAYQHRPEAAQMGENARRLVEEKFSLDAVGKQMSKRLEEISKLLTNT